MAHNSISEIQLLPIETFDILTLPRTFAFTHKYTDDVIRKVKLQIRDITDVYNTNLHYHLNDIVNDSQYNYEYIQDYYDDAFHLDSVGQLRNGRIYLARICANINVELDGGNGSPGIMFYTNSLPNITFTHSNVYDNVSSFITYSQVEDDVLAKYQFFLEEKQNNVYQQISEYPGVIVDPLYPSIGGTIEIHNIDSSTAANNCFNLIIGNDITDNLQSIPINLIKYNNSIEQTPVFKTKLEVAETIVNSILNNTDYHSYIDDFEAEDPIVYVRTDQTTLRINIGYSNLLNEADITVSPLIFPNPYILLKNLSINTEYRLGIRLISNHGLRSEFRHDIALTDDWQTQDHVFYARVTTFNLSDQGTIRVQLDNVVNDIIPQYGLLKRKQLMTPTYQEYLQHNHDRLILSDDFTLADEGLTIAKGKGVAAALPTIYDPIIQNGALYEYKLFYILEDEIYERPVLLQTLSLPIVKCNFYGHYISDLNDTYKFIYNTTVKSNLQHSGNIINTLDSQFPLVHYNKQHYYTGSLNAIFMAFFHKNQNRINIGHEYEERQALFQFLNNHTPKILKTEHGDLGFVIIDSMQETPDRAIFGIATIDFSFVEIDNILNNDKIIQYNFLQTFSTTVTNRLDYTNYLCICDPDIDQYPT